MENTLEKNNLGKFYNEQKLTLFPVFCAALEREDRKPQNVATAGKPFKLCLSVF